MTLRKAFIKKCTWDWPDTGLARDWSETELRLTWYWPENDVILDGGEKWPVTNVILSLYWRPLLVRNRSVYYLTSTNAWAVSLYDVSPGIGLSIALSSHFVKRKNLPNLPNLQLRQFRPSFGLFVVFYWLFFSCLCRPFSLYNILGVCQTKLIIWAVWTRRSILGSNCTIKYWDWPETGLRLTWENKQTNKQRLAFLWLLSEAKSLICPEMQFWYWHHLEKNKSQSNKKLQMAWKICSVAHRQILQILYSSQSFLLAPRPI